MLATPTTDPYSFTNGGTGVSDLTTTADNNNPHNKNALNDIDLSSSSRQDGLNRTASRRRGMTGGGLSRSSHGGGSGWTRSRAAGGGAGGGGGGLSRSMHGGGARSNSPSTANRGRPAGGGGGGGGLSRSMHGGRSNSPTAANRGGKKQFQPGGGGGLNHSTHGRVGTGVPMMTCPTKTSMEGGGARKSLDAQDLCAMPRPTALNRATSTPSSLNSSPGANGNGKRSHGYSSRLRSSFLNASSSFFGGIGLDTKLSTTAAPAPIQRKQLSPRLSQEEAGGMLQEEDIDIGGPGGGGLIMESEDLIPIRSSGGLGKYDSRMLRSDEHLMSFCEMQDVSTYSQEHSMHGGSYSSRRGGHGRRHGGSSSSEDEEHDESTVSGFLNARMATFWNNVEMISDTMKGEEVQDDDDYLEDYLASNSATMDNQRSGAAAAKPPRFTQSLEGIREILSTRSLHGSSSGINGGGGGRSSSSFLGGNPQDNSYSGSSRNSGSSDTGSTGASAVGYVGRTEIFQKNMETLSHRFSESTSKDEEDNDHHDRENHQANETTSATKLDQEQIQREMSAPCGMLDGMGGKFSTFFSARLVTFSHNVDFVQDWTKEVANDVGSSDYMPHYMPQPGHNFETFSKNVDFVQGQAESIAHQLGDKMVDYSHSHSTTYHGGADANDSFYLHQSHPNVFLNI